MVPTYLAKGYTMNRELEIAVERAARAAVVDPLVEALEALEYAHRTISELEHRTSQFVRGDLVAFPVALLPQARVVRDNAAHVLAKYAPDRAGGGE